MTESQHKNIVFSRLSDIKHYIENLKWSEKANTEVTKISSKSITDEHKKIFDDHFNKQYIQRFDKETKNLDVNFRIDVKPKGSYGKTSRKLEILSHSPSDILSEGQ